MKITVSRHELLAAMLFTSADESRLVLSGVLIEAKPNSKPIVIATDGKRLVVIETSAEQSSEELFAHEHSLLMRADFLKAITALSKAFGGKTYPWICFENSQGSKRVQVSLVGPKVFLESEDGALIEGNYPNWKQIIPPDSAKREPVSALGLNAEYVGDFAKAGKILELETPVLQMRLTGADSVCEVRLCGCPHFYGLIMPCHTEDAEFQPEFLGIVEQFESEDKETKPPSGDHAPTETETAQKD